MSKYFVKDFLLFVAVRRLHTQVTQVETVTTSFQEQTSRQISVLVLLTCWFHANECRNILNSGLWLGSLFSIHVIST